MKEDSGKLTPFTFIDQIMSKRNTIDYDPKICSGYFMIYHFSLFKEYIKIVDKIVPLMYHLGDKAIYEYFMSEIPRGKKFIRWPKDKKEELLEKGIEQIMSKYPDMSSKEARRVVSFFIRRKKYVK